nr:hypothetical protein [Gordonia westfalica]
MVTDRMLLVSAPAKRVIRPHPASQLGEKINSSRKAGLSVLLAAGRASVKQTVSIGLSPVRTAGGDGVDMWRVMLNVAALLPIRTATIATMSSHRRRCCWRRPRWSPVVGGAVGPSGGGGGDADVVRSARRCCQLATSAGSSVNAITMAVSVRIVGRGRSPRVASFRVVLPTPRCG